MTGIKIPVSAEFDGADVEKTVTKLNAQMNKLAQSIAAVNKVSFKPVSSGSLDELKKVESKFQELLKISGALRDRMKATGQIGTGFSGVDWDRLYDDPSTRTRKMAQAYQHVTAGTRYGLGGATPAPASPPPGGAGGGGAGGGGGSAVGGALAGVAGAGVRAMGPVGGVVANSVGAGMSGGFGAGLIGLAGGLAALAVGKGVSAIKDKVDAAGAEGVGYDTLKRTLGDVNVSFNLLRQSLRDASDRIDVTFEESQRMGQEFAKISGRKIDVRDLGDELSIGGGFGRSFGVDPQQSSQFFAQQRQFGVTSDANGSRRLALMIGEAVAKSSSFGKTDELLTLIASYTGQQARNGLAAPNVAGYSGLLSGLVGSGVPGLDPQGAAALLGRVNSAISGGGAIGEAGQNYLFSVLGKANGLDPVQTSILQQQGAFGTGRMAFGDGSLYSKFAKKFGMGIPGAAANSDQTNLAAILESQEKQFAGSRRPLMANATARLLGVNESQAMALHTIGPEKVDGMMSRMARLGLDYKQMSSTGSLAMANIETGNDDTLRAQAKSLQANKKQPLSDDESKKLNKAIDDFNKGGDSEKLKDILTTLTYSREQEQTEGGKTRESIQGVDKSIQKMATGLVGPMNDMRNAMVHLAGNGKKTATQINQEIAGLQYEETVAPLNARRAEIDKQLETASQFKEGVRGHKWTPAELADRETNKKTLQAERAEIDAKINAARKVREEAFKGGGTSGRAPTAQQRAEAGMSSAPSGEVLAELAKTDKVVGLAPGTSAAQIQKESGFNPVAYNKRSGAMGMAQVMPRTLATLEKRFGRKLDPFNQNDAIFIHREVMRENKERFGSDAGALAAYNSGWNPGKWGNPETTDYLSKIERWRGGFTPMPEGAKRGAPNSDTPKVMIEGTFNLQGQQNGSRAAEPIVIKKTVDAPRASGV